MVHRSVRPLGNKSVLIESISKHRSTSTAADKVWQRQLFSAPEADCSLLFTVFWRHIVLFSLRPADDPHILTFHNVFSAVWLDRWVVNHFVQFSSWYQYMAIWGSCGKPTILGLNSWISDVIYRKAASVRPACVCIIDSVCWFCWYNHGPPHTRDKSYDH